MTGKIIKLVNHVDHNGSLVCLENNVEIPFKVKRIFFISNVAPGGIRGEHAAKNAEFLFVVVCGCARVTLDTGRESKEYFLSDKTDALFVETGTWITVDHFSQDALLLVMSSETYQKCRYISDYKEFRCFKEEGL